MLSPLYMPKTMDEQAQEELCETCGHDSGPHVLLATVFGPVGKVEDVPLGGHMFCQEEGCNCYHTWSLPEEYVGSEIKERIGPKPHNLMNRLRSEYDAKRRREIISELPTWPPDHEVRYKPNDSSTS